MDGPQPSFSRRQRSNAALNLAVSILAALALLVMLNYLAARHFRRWFWTNSDQYQLSPRTHQVLASLTNKIHITVYFDSEDELYGRVTGLLKEYQFASPMIEVQRVDYLKDFGAAKQVKAKYKLTQTSDKNLIIFDCEGRPPAIATTSDLSVYDLDSVIAQRTREVRRTAFLGEMVFTSKIFGVANPRALKAYFLHGHGEHDPNLTDKSNGYAKFAEILRNECSVPWETLSFLGTNDVPSDCSLLIIAGPILAFSPSDLEKLQRYLETGGRMLVFFNHAPVSLNRPTGLEKFLAKYEIKVGEDLVWDPQHSPDQGLDIQPIYLGSHPIVMALGNMPVVLYKPRTIRQVKANPRRSDSTKVDELLFTGSNSTIVTTFDLKQIPRIEPDRNERGSVPLMAVVERGAVPGVSAERGAMRLAVIGDSYFLQNDAIENVAHRDFAAATINWLVGQDFLLSGVAPRPVVRYSLTLTQAKMVAIRWILLVGFPGGVVLIGTLVWWRRRS